MFPMEWKKTTEIKSGAFRQLAMGSGASRGGGVKASKRKR